MSAHPWQPIATAPRDGTNILIRFGQDGVSQAKYIPGLPHPWQFIDTNDGITWMINRSVDKPLYGPSHWMPFPEYATPAPAQPEGAQDEESVGAAELMPKTAGVFTTAMFDANEVPPGTKLYTHPSRVAAPAQPDPLHVANERGEEAKDAARYRRFFDAGLPITFMGVEYEDKASLDAAIDADLAQEGKT